MFLGIVQKFKLLKVKKKLGPLKSWRKIFLDLVQIFKLLKSKKKKKLRSLKS